MTSLFIFGAMLDFIVKRILVLVYRLLDLISLSLTTNYIFSASFASYGLYVQVPISQTTVLSTQV